MKSRHLIRTASCLGVCALAAAISLCAQPPVLSAPPTLQFSNCQSAQAASPGGRWTLTGNFVSGACPPTATYPAEGTHDPFAAQYANDFGVVLYLEDASTHSRRPIRFAGYDGQAAWSPSGEAFYVNDHMASNATDAWLYFAGSLRRINLRDAIRHADHAAASYFRAHAYFQSRQWLDARTALVQLCGHTDTAPSQQFDLRYSVDLKGRVQRLSMQLRPVTDDNVLSECE